MNKRFLLHIIAPTILISLLLFGLGLVAAWNVQRQQATSSDILAQEVHNILAAEELLLVVSDVRHRLERYVRHEDEQDLFDSLPLCGELEQYLAEINGLARTSEEKAIVEQLTSQCRRFQAGLERIIAVDDDRDDQAEELLDTVLNGEIIQTIGTYAEANRRAVLRTTEANGVTADQMRQGFLLLGICGGGAGLIAGLAIARGVGRTILQLDVSVRGAADRLRDVMEPITIHSVGFHDLREGLGEIEKHIGDVVDRLQQREFEILRQQQLASVGQLAAGLAHELRNPLMPVKMLVQKALKRSDSNLMSRDQLEVIHQEIQRLESLISEFLEFAKPQELQKRRIDFQHVVRHALDLASPRATLQDVKIRTTLPEGPLELDADPFRLQQVLLNLFLNALDAQPSGGTIELAVSRVRLAAEAGDGLRVILSDQGPGIPGEILSRIFEPFLSTRETGTGLGLPISQRIIADHGADLSVRNSPSGGAVIEFTLPAPSHSSDPQQPAITGDPGTRT